jgi:hypothetical protein
VVTADRPAVFVTVDTERGLALLRGREAERVAYLLSPPSFEWAPEFSPSGRGWLVPAPVAADVVAWGQLNRELVIMHGRKDTP